MNKNTFYDILNFILGKYKTTITQQVNTFERKQLFSSESHTDVGTEIWEGDHLFLSFKGYVFENKVRNVELKINLPSHIMTINARNEEGLKIIEDTLMDMK